MVIFKAIKSAFETVGIFVVLSMLYGTEDMGLLEYSIAGVVALATVILSDGAFKWAAQHFEIEECPYCGAELEYEEVEK